MFHDDNIFHYSSTFEYSLHERCVIQQNLNNYLITGMLFK